MKRKKAQVLPTKTELDIILEVSKKQTTIKQLRKKFGDSVYKFLFRLKNKNYVGLIRINKNTTNVVLTKKSKELLEWIERWNDG